jgi:hypothetical protein
MGAAQPASAHVALLMQLNQNFRRDDSLVNTIDIPDIRAKIFNEAPKVSSTTADTDFQDLRHRAKQRNRRPRSRA